MCLTLCYMNARCDSLAPRCFRNISRPTSRPQMSTCTGIAVTNIGSNSRTQDYILWGRVGGGRDLLSPVGRRMRRVSTAAASRDRAALGHHATHCMTPPSVQVRVHLPVRTSHRRTVPSSEAEASHWPEESGDMLRTYTPETEFTTK